jgi:hypothetical protein
VSIGGRVLFEQGILHLQMLPFLACVERYQTGNAVLSSRALTQRRRDLGRRAHF